MAATLIGLKNSQFTGLDGMSTWLLKTCSQELIKPLTVMVNNSFAEGIFPDYFKIAKVIPIYKNGDKEAMTNYRPISLLHAISKVFEKLFLKRLKNFLKKLTLWFRTSLDLLKCDPDTTVDRCCSHLKCEIRDKVDYRCYH